MGFHRHISVLPVVLLLAAAFLMASCTRSASTPPAPIEEGTGTATPSGLTSQQMTMEAVRSALLTQTAQAGGEGATEPPDEPVNPTETQPPQTTSLATSTTGPAATPIVGTVPATYTLQDGEHPYCIARRFDIDPNALLAVNGLDSSSLASPGMTLTIPQNADPFPGPRALRQHPASYTVQPGETIYAVACIFGDVYPIAIAQANNLSEPYNVSPGTVLQIP